MGSCNSYCTKTAIIHQQHITIDVYIAYESTVQLAARWSGLGSAKQLC